MLRCTEVSQLSTALGQPRHIRRGFGLLLLTQQRSFRRVALGEAQGHVWTVPAVQEESDILRSVRVQPCIRPESLTAPWCAFSIRQARGRQGGQAWSQWSRVLWRGRRGPPRMQ